MDDETMTLDLSYQTQPRKADGDAQPRARPEDQRSFRRRDSTS